MKKTVFFAACAVAVSAGMLSASDFNLDGMKLRDIKARQDIEVPKAEPKDAKIFGLFESKPKPELTPLPEKEWTVMAFINARNDVALPGLLELNELEKVGTTGSVNVVAEFAKMKINTLDFTSNANRRYLLQQDSSELIVKSPVLLERQNVDMGDYRNVVDFVQWTKKYFPARHYVLIIWDHGTGFVDPMKNVAVAPTGTSGAAGTKAISFDFVTKNHITTPELAELLRQSGKLDVLVLNACLMLNAEVSYELKDYAPVTLGSEEVMSAAGFDYADFLAKLNDAPGSTAEQAADILAKGYIAFYQSNNMGAHVTALRPGKMNAFGAKLSEWVTLAMKVKDTAALNAARDGVIRFELDPTNDKDKTISFTGDLYDFLEIYNRSMTASGPEADALRAKGEELMSFISGEMVAKYYAFGSERTGKPFSRAHGLSIHIPMVKRGVSYFAALDAKMGTRYADLRMSKETRWLDFLKWVYEAK